MSDRRSFLTFGVTSLLLAAASPAAAQTAPDAAAPEAAPSVLPATPAASASAAKGPSAAAAAVAATMRRFDPKLDDAEVAKIAAAIDDNLGAGAALNPKKKRLKNSDEPTTRFAAGDR